MHLKALACLGALALLALAAGGPARSMPQTVDYTCSPAWDEGDTLEIDWNSGHKSITARFPNGSEMTMALETGGSGFRYGEADTEIFGKNQQRITVHEGGEPNRVCTAQ